MSEYERCWDRLNPERMGEVTKSMGLNAFVVWDDGEEGWQSFDQLGSVPPGAEDGDREDGRKPYEFVGLIYLHEHEVEDFENALEEAICPDENSEPDAEDHDCRLGVWTLKSPPPEDE